MQENNERSAREQRRDNLIRNGYNPYPARVVRTHTCEEVNVRFDEFVSSSSLISLVGRLRSKRVHGGSCFLNIEDESGRLQLFLRKDGIGEGSYNFFIDHVDIGDFVEASGKPYKTRRGEKSILVEQVRIIAKSLEPLPEKWHGLSDIEIRYRQRYLDLIANPEVRQIFRKRARMLGSLRRILDEEGFLEVETPILQPLAGGALARPFRTHHNALGTDLFMRIAPELYLKRLTIGGYEKVYEIARCFRNEGIDHAHNPEFTQVEFYAAYWDYEQMMKFTERLLERIITAVNGSLSLAYQAHDIEWSPPFPRITFSDAIAQMGQIRIDDFPKASTLAAEIKKRGIRIQEGDEVSRARLLDALLKETVQPHLIQPTFVYRYPIELSPLAKKTEDDEQYVERFQLFAGGVELVNAFSELNDPQDQEKRFIEQQKQQGADAEAHPVDADFVKALAYGMPPTAGLGMGLDRLMNILTNTNNIKEVLFFPTLKPKD